MTAVKSSYSRTGLRTGTPFPAKNLFRQCKFKAHHIFTKIKVISKGSFYHHRSFRLKKKISKDRINICKVNFNGNWEFFCGGLPLNCSKFLGWKRKQWRLLQIKFLKSWLEIRYTLIYYVNMLEENFMNKISEKNAENLANVSHNDSFF